MSTQICLFSLEKANVGGAVNKGVPAWVVSASLKDGEHVFMGYLSDVQTATITFSNDPLNVAVIFDARSQAETAAYHLRNKRIKGLLVVVEKVYIS